MSRSTAQPAVDGSIASLTKLAREQATWLAPVAGGMLGWIVDLVLGEVGGLYVGALVGFAFALGGMKREIVQKLDTHSERMARRFTELREINKLYDEVEECAVDTRRFISLMQMTSRIHKSFDPLVVEIITDQMESLKEVLDQVHTGQLHVEGAQMNWFATLTERAEHTIKAVSTQSVDGTFWQRDDGYDYLQRQQRRISKDGITVQRIFVLSPDDADAEGSLVDGSDVWHAMNAQCGANIDVRYLIPGPGDQIRDLAIFDDDLVLETTLRANGAISHTDLRFDEEHLEDALRSFELLLRSAQRFRPKGATGTWGDV